MSYWRLHYHLVWATSAREPLIDAEREAVVHRTLSGKTHELRVFLHAVGNTADHIHVVVSIPPTLAVAECARQLKGASSHAVNHMLPRRELFRWQAGYGAVTVSEERLPAVVGYAKNQRQHHAQGTLMQGDRHCCCSCHASGSERFAEGEVVEGLAGKEPASAGLRLLSRGLEPTRSAGGIHAATCSCRGLKPSAE